MQKYKSCWGVLFVLLTSFLPIRAEADKYTVVAEGSSQVVFDSRAPMEKFQGKTNHVSGWLEADLSDLTQAVAMEITVDLASFDTGKGKRNKHMRENHLETEEFPLAVFKGGQLSELSATSLTAANEVDFVLVGTLDLHGVEREMQCHVSLALATDGDLLVTAKFVVLLPDHHIKRPKFLVVKLAEDQKVTVSLKLKKEI